MTTLQVNDDQAVVDLARATAAKASGWLDVTQHQQGWWKGDLDTNVTMDAEDLMLRHYLGILDEFTAAKTRDWILRQRRPDSTWATFLGGPSELSATIEAYTALRLAGVDREDQAMVASAAWIRRNGGIEGSRVFTRIWLAILGWWRWTELPVLPPEIMLLPPSVPFNIYDFAAWARQTVVALTVVMAHRPSMEPPFALDELRADGTTRRPAPTARSEEQSPAEEGTVPKPRGATNAGLAKGLRLLDKVLQRYEALGDRFPPRNALRRHCLRKAEQWILQRQEADGCWGGIQPPLVYSIIALNLQGYPLDHPVLAAALKGMEGFILDDDHGRRVEACQSPVWDTALATIALVDAGADPEGAVVKKARDWLYEKQIDAPGDWSVRRPDLVSGGWAFEFANANYPDIDDSAEVVLALRRGGRRQLDQVEESAIARGAAWTAGMQSRDGGWGAFDVDNDSSHIGAIPFCDFGEVIDPASADVTAHVLEMLVNEPDADPVVIREGVRWLLDQQEADGSWFGRWGVNYVYGTGSALPALRAAGMDPSDPVMRRAVAWLEQHQNPDGGWGEDLRSYIYPSWKGKGTSTASQTGWALLALLAAGERHSPSAKAGVRYLAETINADGSWSEDLCTGTGFPWDFTINYHLYRQVWPLMALGRYASGQDLGAV